MNTKTTSHGSLTLVATPIGNLSDTTERASAILNSADCIACEDTRVTGKLLAKLNITRQGALVSYREENEKQVSGQLADRIEAGEHIALVSDAGMPAISDPGFRLVRECQKRALRVSSAPGATACSTALAVSGLPTDGFLFGGFLPPKSAARKRFFEKYLEFEYTIVLYESCHRIGKFLDDLIDTLGSERSISVARELTKLHETVISGVASEVRHQVMRASQKGEFVVCIAKKGYVI